MGEPFYMVPFADEDAIRRADLPPQVTATVRLVWQAVMRLSNERRGTPEVDAGIGLVAELASVSYRTAQDRLADLERIGFLKGVADHGRRKRYLLLRGLQCRRNGKGDHAATVEPTPAGDQPVSMPRETADPKAKKYRAAFDALRATGKFPTLTVQNLAALGEASPQAMLHEGETFKRLVLDTADVCEPTVAKPIAWLRTRMRGVEKCTPVTGRGSRDEGYEPRPQIYVPMKDRAGAW